CPICAVCPRRSSVWSPSASDPAHCTGLAWLVQQSLGICGPPHTQWAPCVYKRQCCLVLGRICTWSCDSVCLQESENVNERLAMPSGRPRKGRSMTTHSQ